MISYWSTSPAAAGPAAERSPHLKVPTFKGDSTDQTIQTAFCSPVAIL